MKALSKLAAVILFPLLAAAVAAAPSELRVLYVGHDPSNVSLTGPEQSTSEPQRLLAMKKARTPAFEKFLREHFRRVEVVYAENYRESMSAGYDVTIFDAPPPVIRARVFEQDPATGRTTRYEPPHYLTADFDHAALLISDVSPRIAEPLQYKMDWYCLCLDAHAHGINLSHPIFHTPHKVAPTIEFLPTPQTYRHYYNGRNLPDTLPMWRVQTEGYIDGKGFPPGLVSSGAGFMDGGDSEVISNGVCTKDVSAVALGRHGNFFHWGFSAGPEELTPEGRLTFINAVHYIAKFKGQRPYSHRPYRTHTRELALDLARMMASANYEEWAEQQRRGHESRKQYLRQVQKSGRTLSPQELEALEAPMPALPDREQWLKQEVLGRMPDGVVALFGVDLGKYLPYYEMNLEYLRPGSRPYTYEVDEDVRSLAVSNREVRLLELCVAMLESNVEAEKARRILTRYTGEHFQSAQEWRQWLDHNRGRLYFSDVDGFRFHVAPEPLGTRVARP